MATANFQHALIYPDNSDIPLSDIAATLLAHERLLPIVGDVLEGLIPGLTVEHASIRLDYLRHGSLDEAFFVALLVVYQTDITRAVHAMLSEIPGQPIPEVYDSLITVIIFTLLFTGTRFIIEKAKGGKTPGVAGPHIEGDYNTYVSIVADTLNVSDEAVKDSIKKAIGKTRQPVVARAAIDLFRPAKRGLNGRILPRNAPPISQETVAEFPTAIALAELEKDTVPIPIPDARVKIRATDRDKQDRGWAGKILNENFTSKRLPLVLSPDVDPDRLAALDEVCVEAVLESKMLEDGRTKPYRIHIMRLLDD